jgi:hypothetical protein
MAGKMGQMIDEIIEKRSNGNAAIENAIGTRPMIKGINRAKYLSTAEDDTEVFKRLAGIAGTMM